MYFLGGLAMTGREGAGEGSGSSSKITGSGDTCLVVVTGRELRSKKRRACAKEGEGGIIWDFGETLMGGWSNLKLG